MPEPIDFESTDYKILRPSDNNEEVVTQTPKKNKAKKKKKVKQVSQININVEDDFVQ